MRDGQPVIERNAPDDPESALEKLAGQVSVALENTRLITDLADLFMSTITALSEAIDAKSPWTKGHSERVAGFAVAAAREMGRPEKEVHDLRIAGLLHDVGKIGTYDVLLDKPGRLTEEEYAAVREHTARGAKILSSIKQLAHVVPWVRGHHEYWNGKGYPDGLKGEEIPLQARILAVADTFDSMTAERPYRCAQPAPHGDVK
ncbi:MAG: HD-GYP domain-containing protein [Nitrospirae bacterium]|nr:HD-GYP domain-containing protein [Nitrospirota bacterium]